MTIAAADAVSPARDAPVRRPKNIRPARQVDPPRFLIAVSAAVLAFMFLPLAVVVIYSFNGRKSLVTFGGFSTRWYAEAWHNDALKASLSASIEIAAVTTLVCAVCGTLLALALARGTRRFAAASSATVLLRLVTPETVTAVSLFVVLTQASIPLSAGTVVLGHIALCIPFVAVIVRSRLDSMNPEVEDAAMDLGATRLHTLRLVVLPMLWPSIAASGLLTFVLSFDDFVTSFYTAGTNTPPLPMLIYSMLRFGVSPVVNVIGIVMIVFTLAGAGAAYLILRVAGRSRTPSAQAKTEGV